MTQSVVAATAVLLGVSLLAAGRASYDARPPLAHTGGFGEPSCRECHFDGPTRPPEALSLGGVPEQYEPGSAYRLAVSIKDSTARVGGFQLAARVAGGAHAGTQAGTLCAVDARVALAADTATGVQYASHAGAAQADSMRWQLVWHAPAEDVGAVVFHVAANSANDDDSMLGDVIILGSWTTRGQESGVRGQGVSGARLKESACSSLPKPVP